MRTQNPVVWTTGTPVVAAPRRVQQPPAHESRYDEPRFPRVPRTVRASRGWRTSGPVGTVTVRHIAVEVDAPAKPEGGRGWALDSDRRIARHASANTPTVVGDVYLPSQIVTDRANAEGDWRFVMQSPGACDHVGEGRCYHYEWCVPAAVKR